MTLEDVLGVLADVINKDHASNLADFLRKHYAPDWVIASDYVIGDRDRHRDSFCYTIYPIDDGVVRTQADIRRLIPADLKNTGAITDNLVACLRSPRQFSFCFVRRPGEQFFDSVADVRTMLDETLAMVEGRQNWDEQVRMLRRLRQDASANGFKFNLFSNIILASLFAAVIAMYIAKLTDARTVSWFSDRDSIMTAYNKIAVDLFGMHFPQACRKYGVRYEPIRLTFAHIIRSTNLMVSMPERGAKRRDPHKLSPHHHDDFEQVSVSLSGTWVHHLRVPWTPDMTTWRDDEHVTLASPSALVIPAGLIHTSQDVGDDNGWIIDVFSSPRADLSLQPGWVLNGDDYPAADTQT